MKIWDVDMVIHIYSLCWNDAAMLPYYFRHYDAIADRYFIFDDGSTDASLNILEAHPQVEINRFEREDPDSLVASATLFNNRAWKQSRDEADWVIVCNIDEHHSHPDLPNYLRQCQCKGITAIPAEGWQMVSDRFPKTKELLCDSVTRGIRWDVYDKIGFFNPNAIDEINYGPGRHHADPAGRVFYPKHGEMKLLHYKYLGLDYLIRRSTELRTGLRRTDIERGWGEQYLWKREKMEKKFNDIFEKAVELPRTECDAKIRPTNPYVNRYLRVLKNRLLDPIRRKESAL